MPWHNIS